MTFLLVIAVFFWAQKYLNSPLKETTINQSVQFENGQLDKIKKLP